MEITFTSKDILKIIVDYCNQNFLPMDNMGTYVAPPHYMSDIVIVYQLNKTTPTKED